MRQFRLSILLSAVVALLAITQRRTHVAAAVEKVFRKRNLDYLNADTLQYFLQHPKLDYDAVVMFYANWDRNSHSFANLYAQMAELLQAGTQESKLILGLFDCEADATHAKLCTQAGITHYPTTVYFSFATKGGRHHKFGGNWMYGDAVLDWIKTLRALSGWRRAGWGARLRRWVLGRGSSAASQAKPELPVGIPSSMGSGSGGGTVTGRSAEEEAATAAAAVKALEQVRQLQDETKGLNELLVRSAAMMEAVLFPMTYYSGPDSSRTRDAHKNYTDLFAYLNQTAGWTSRAATTTTATTKSPDVEARQQVLRACLQDVALEYCQRFSAIATEEFFAEHPDALTNASATTQDLIAQVADHLQSQEPYCAIVEACVVGDFASERCRPAVCPFEDPVACRFLTSCFYESMQQQYAQALGVSLPNATSSLSANQGANKPPREQETSAAAPPKKKSAWGF